MKPSLAFIFANFGIASGVYFTEPINGVAAGGLISMTWADAEGPVALLLDNGPQDALQIVDVIDGE
jgi:hypothetical protein